MQDDVLSGDHEPEACDDKPPPCPRCETLSSKIQELEQKAKDQWERSLRVEAEARNRLSRMERDVEQSRKYALEQFVSALGTVLDSLSGGLKAVSSGKSDAEALLSMQEGMGLMHQQMLSVFEKFSVAVLNPVGEAFNPNHHDAVAMVPHPEAATGTVIEVVQPGLLLSDRLVRPARVVVSKGPLEK